MELEYENGMLIVDELINEPSLSGSILVRIDNEYFIIRNAFSVNPIKQDSLRPYMRHVNEKWERATLDYDFLMANLMPRGGYKVPVKRPATHEEFELICKELGLDEGDISSEFEDKIGDVYGKYAKTIKRRQIRVPELEAIPLERKLRKMGIEASNISPGRVNIMTGLGDKREGAI